MSNTIQNQPSKTNDSMICQIIRPILIKCFFLMRLSYDWIVDLIFSFIYEDKSFLLPPIKDKLMLESATSIARKIKNKEVSCVTVVKAFIERIEQVNEQLNAVVDTRFEKALKEAEEVDKMILLEQNIKDKPFLGVPFTTKESTACKDLSNTLGVVARKGIKAGEDATIVAKMKESGAILLGVTNVPELMWSESRNLIYGQTNNPYNFSRTPGASSGGEACIISACGSGLGLGSDLGGSVRIPALYCGVYGHKITTGSASTKGIYGRDGNEGKTMVSVGPIVRHAEDILPITKCIVSKENLSKFNFDKPIDLTELKIFYVEDPGDLRQAPMSSEMISCIRKCVKSLEQISKHPANRLTPIKQFQNAFDVWRYWISKEKEDLSKKLLDNKGQVSWWKELLKIPFGLCTICLPSIIAILEAKLIPYPSDRWGQEQTNILKTKLTELLLDDGVLIFPSAPESAPYHYATFFRLFNFTYWAIFNILDVPVVQVPVGLGKNGVPLGVQVVAATYNDKLCCAVAEYLEKNGVAGWIPPFKVE